MKRSQLYWKNSGSVVAFATIFSAALIVLILSLAGFEKMHSHQSNYIEQMERTMQFADSALSSSMGLISRDPAAFLVDVNLGGLNNKWTQVPAEDGSYKTTVKIRNIPEAGIYYIVTVASRTVAGKMYQVTLHTYARISNVADYFAAINSDVRIGHPTDLANGKVYGLTITFDRSAPYTEGGKTVDGSGLPGTTFVKNANFLTQSWPDVDCSAPPCRWTNTVGSLSDVKVVDGGTNLAPTKLSAPLLLPQILGADMQNFKSLATPAHVDTRLNFTGSIYPPGYNGTHAVGDTYAGHTTDNSHHIYYITAGANSDVNVSGTVYGQVIIVAEGNIHITGDIRSADPGSGPSMNPQVGTGVSSSTAHQLVLVPGPNKKVFIDPSVCTAPYHQAQTVQIQALVLNPNGTIDPSPMGTGTTCINNKDYLTLDFKGSMVLGTQPPFHTYFNIPTGNIYSYMDSLATSPPPYLPSITEIEDSFSQIDSPGLF